MMASFHRLPKNEAMDGTSTGAAAGCAFTKAGRFEATCAAGSVALRFSLSGAASLVFSLSLTASVVAANTGGETPGRGAVFFVAAAPTLGEKNEAIDRFGIEDPTSCRRFFFSWTTLSPLRFACFAAGL